MDKGDQQSGAQPKNPMTEEDAARIPSAYAKQHGGKVDKGSFPARAQVWQAVCSKIKSLQYMSNPLNNGFI